MAGSLRPLGWTSVLTWTTWRLASVLFLFAAENIWFDPWLRNKLHYKIPSLVPKQPGGVWFLTLILGGIALALLVVCQTLLIRDRNVQVRRKVGTGLAIFAVILLCVQWFRVTERQPGVLRLAPRGKAHTVTLTWKASSSPVIGYNVYRSTRPAGNYVKINLGLVRGLTYTDNAAQSGVTYYYVARAVDARGIESINSNEASAAIP
jgi:hypothetical protein